MRWYVGTACSMSLKILRSIFRVCACCSCVRPSLWTRSFRSARYLRHRSAGFHFHDSEATVEIAATNDFRASSGARQKQPARGSHFKTDVLRLFVGLTRKSFSVPEPRIRLPRAAQASYRSRIASRVAMMRSDADRGPVRTNPRQCSVVSEPVGQHYVEKRRRWIARFACLPSAQPGGSDEVRPQGCVNALLTDDAPWTLLARCVAVRFENAVNQKI